MKKILLIDNYDSFTYNLVQYLTELDVEVLVHRNDAISINDVHNIAPNGIIFSPGPGSVEIPDDIGIGPEVFQNFRGKVPILGVCLGHQMIGHLLGGTIEKTLPVHGQRWPISIVNHEGLFAHLPDSIEGMRYHSMVVSQKNFPTELQITAYTEKRDSIMAFENREERVFGIQFHPESVGTKSGKEILKNFISFL